MQRRARLNVLAVWVAVALGLATMWARYGATLVTALLTVLPGGAAVAQAIVTLLTRSRPVSSEEQLDRAAGSLASEVRAQWEAEARRRLLADTDSLPVRWQGEGGFSGRSGEIGDLVSSYVRDPGRLVVVGEPGSGKTSLCVTLTLELLRHFRRARVPVLLQVSSWNPVEHLHTWLIRTIMEHYPFLGDEARYGAAPVQGLLAQNRVIVVLDGLDEMVEDQRSVALQAIERDARGSEPLVLTSRSREFETANASGIVGNARVVRLLPVGKTAAVHYLRDAATGTGPDRWEPVLSQLLADGDIPVVRVLQTPLMLFLARTAYAEPASTPAELLALADVRKVEEHLLDSFTRQVFTLRPPSPLVTSARPVQQWDRAKAERWLAFLARNCGREIAWWRLYRLVPQAVRLSMGVLLGGLACLLLGWLMFGLFGRAEFGILLGTGVGVAGGVVLSFVPPEAPRRFVPRPLGGRELARDLLSGAIGALVGGIVVGVLWGAAFGVLIGLVFGIAFGLVSRFTEPTEPREAVTPASVLRSDEAAVVYAAGLGGVTGVLAGAVMGGVVGVAKQGLVIPVSNPALVGLLGAGVGALLGACGLGLVTQASSASWAFTVTRIWLALGGMTPLRLMSFLADAHQLGVLRQVGPYYQFRHAALQDRLALRQ